MKKVLIKCIYPKPISYIIKIYNDNQLLLIDEINYNEYCVFYGNNNFVYDIYFYSEFYILKSSFYVSDKYNKPYIFYLNPYCLKHLIKITFLDKLYNLPIEKGDIFLWQNHIQ